MSASLSLLTRRLHTTATSIASTIGNGVTEDDVKALADFLRAALQDPGLTLQIMKKMPPRVNPLEVK